MTTAKKKTVRKRVRANDRNWRRDLMARDIFIALIVSHHGAPRGPGITSEVVWASCASEALEAAEVFEKIKTSRGAR